MQGSQALSSVSLATIFILKFGLMKLEPTLTGLGLKEIRHENI